MRASSGERGAWSLDQLAKSEFFHQRLHDWRVLQVAYEIERVKGEQLTWGLEELGISEEAWNKVIHRGIKPVVVFAHPQVLLDLRRSISYYRMLAMVSQKSMIRVGLPVNTYEHGRRIADASLALAMAQQFNQIISRLVQADEEIDLRELDLWRGMAAGSQAQGSWQNTKGDRIPVVIRGTIRHRLREKLSIAEETSDASRVVLRDGREVVFSDEPDVGFYREGEILAGVEIKGGIDPAGVLERVGAAIKSLSRVKEANPNSVTALILQGVSLTRQAENDLRINRQAVNHWFRVEEILYDMRVQEEFFRLLGI